MIYIEQISNRLIISIISAALIFVIGYFDWFTGYEFSLSLFYLIPVALLALYKNVNTVQLVINSFFSASVWILADLYTEHTYSNIFFRYWEGFVRFSIYLIISLLIFRLKNEHKKLLENNEKLKNLNEEKNILLGIAAHDLRSPIGLIQTLSDIILTDAEFASENIEKKIEIIHQSASKAVGLITDLLDVSRIESGIVNIKFQKNDYVEFADNCIALNQLIADKKEILIKVEHVQDSIFADFDPFYLEEVLNNLLTNAIKYSHPRSTITVRICEISNRILTEIVDQGVGISEKEIESLFQPFQKSSSKPTSGESSNGLGLAIVKKIVMLHQGETGIRSNPNEGTTVYFYLPVQFKRNNQVMS